METRGGQVDDGSTDGPLVAEVRHGSLDAMDALAHCQFRRSDQDGLGKPGRGIDLDFHRNGVDAQERKGVQLGEHEEKLTPTLGRGKHEDMKR